MSRLVRHDNDLQPGRLRRHRPGGGGDDPPISGRNAIKTSQLAFPEAACEAVCAESGYDGSAASLASTPLARDSQFRVGWATQMPTVSGDAKKGFRANR